MPIEWTVKSQTVRLIDVFLLGPAMIFAARKLTGYEKVFMLSMGIGTILFNAVNYETVKKIEQLT